MKSVLQQASILHLIVELLHEGKAGTIPELAEFEPIAVDDIVTALSLRTNERHGRDIDGWCHWFVEEYKGASDLDKRALSVTKNLADATRHFVKRLEKRRGDKSDSE